MHKILFVILLATMLYNQPLTAQTVTRFQPSHEAMVQRYLRAARIDSATKNTVFKSTVVVSWLAGGKTGWYRNLLKDSVQEYLYLDAQKGKKQALFQRQRLAEGLKQVGITIDSLRPSLTNLEMPAGKSSMRFTIQGQRVECDLTSYACSKISMPPTPASGNSSRGGRFGSFPGGNTSPDKQWEAYIEKGNLMVKPVGSGATPIQFTTDGTPEKPYGGVYWSPDSKYLAG